MKKKIILIDSTLRDGSHPIHHQFTKKTIRDYAKGAELAGTQILVVGHGNGLGASSLQLGKSLLTDKEMLMTARKELHKTKLAAFLIPGYGTIQDDIKPAISYGIDILFVASHCTEANVTRQHIQYAIHHKIDAYGVLMMSHMVSSDVLLSQARLMQEYGAKGVILMDSAGAYLPKDVTNKISTLVDGLTIDVGFHAHNNLGLAIANSLTSLEAGASIIDATCRGLGAGAGNCQLEVLVAILEKMGIPTGVQLYQCMDNSENIISKIMKKPQEISSVTLASGLAGVFSAFALPAIKAAKMFHVDVRDIIAQLGKKHVVGGQEDSIIKVAVQLKEQKKFLKT
jgi:4-hydroxy 2-oxovalerate aldolase